MTKSCPMCGIDYRHIASTHRLGCGFCYFAYKTEMYYVFKEKQNNAFYHKGKIPKNYNNPVNVFVNKVIERRINNTELKNDLKEALKLNHYNGE